MGIVEKIKEIEAEVIRICMCAVSNSFNRCAEPNRIIRWRELRRTRQPIRELPCCEECLFVTLIFSFQDNMLIFRVSQQRHLGILKARVAKLRAELLETSGGGGGGAAAGPGFAVQR
jgi:hypothetical protein